MTLVIFPKLGKTGPLVLEYNLLLVWDPEGDPEGCCLAIKETGRALWPQVV